MKRGISASVAALAIIGGAFAATAPANAVQSNDGVSVPAGRVVQKVQDSMYWWIDTDWHAGDCTMFHGASWTFDSNGTMSYDGVVTSSDDGDAWLMRVRVLDRNGAELGWVTNSIQQTSDPAQFVKGLPDSDSQYHWLATGHFPANWYGLIGSIEIYNHC
jgi:hypothetical protein